MSAPSYVGRFAPSPSGPLHFGSLVTALGSFLRARQHNGIWRLRIDDIDPPREMDGAKQHILNTLQAHGLQWDGEVIYQSERIDHYRQALGRLMSAGKSYCCQCTRKQIKAAGGIYPGTCRHLSLQGQGLSVRFANAGRNQAIEDKLLGPVTVDNGLASEDFIIWRKDGLVAYHLASVVDDMDFNVSEVVRGADLLEPSVCQNNLFLAFEVEAPDYIHLPVAATKSGFKLSKQNHACALDNNQAINNLCRAIRYLGVADIPAEKTRKIDTLITWTVENWDLSLVPQNREIIIRDAQNQAE